MNPYQPTLKLTETAHPQVCATLDTVHGVLTAFGNDNVEAYKTLHYAWDSYSKTVDAPSTLIDTYRWSIKFQPVMTDPARRGTALVDNVPFLNNALAAIPAVLHHINRRGQIYFLHKTQAQSGAPLFTFKMSLYGNLTSELPEGHEIHEAPNGWVFCRPKFTSLITEAERQIIEESLAVHFRRGSYKIELQRRSLAIYLAESDVDDFLDKGKSLDRDMQYHPAFRFDRNGKLQSRKLTIKAYDPYDNKWKHEADISNRPSEVARHIRKIATEVNDARYTDIRPPIALIDE